MNAALAWLPREPDWTKFALVLLFFLIPLGARFLKWLFQRAGLVEADPEEDEGGGKKESELERRRRVRAELARKEAEGGELWRRLARGEETALPRRAVPRAAEEEEEEEEEEDEPAIPGTLVALDRPQSLPIEALKAAAIESDPAASVSVPSTAVALEASVGRSRPFLRLAPDDLRRAMVLIEIFGAPISLREP